MTLGQQFIELQSQWMSKAIFESRNMLKEAEEKEDYETCIEIKQHIEDGIMSAKKLHIDKYLDQETVITYPKLIFELVKYLHLLAPKGIDKIIQDNVTAYEMIIDDHGYRSIEMRNTPNISPTYDIKNPTHCDCGSVEDGNLYIAERLCDCPIESTPLPLIVNALIGGIYEFIDQQDLTKLYNPIQ